MEALFDAFDIVVAGILGVPASEYKLKMAQEEENDELWGELIMNALEGNPERAKEIYNTL